MEECGVGNYCPYDEMTARKCPSGQYNMKTTSSSVADC
jgi:hypothetical protein